MSATETPPSVFVVGAGVVGTALAAWLARAGVSVLGLHGRPAGVPDDARALVGVVASAGALPDTISRADVVLVAVRDERIAEVARRLADEERLAPGQVVLHASGTSASASVLAAARARVRGVGMLHPLVSFADARVAIEGPSRVAFGVEGDEAARAAALGLVRALGGRPLVLDARSLPLYHAGAVLASNDVVALVDLGRRLLVAAGVPEEDALAALIPLLGSVVGNLDRLGLPGALTGPVARGDVSSVEQHLAALAARAPDLVALYRLLGRDVLRLAREKVPLDPDVVARLEGLFGAPRDGAD